MSAAPNGIIGPGTAADFEEIAEALGRKIDYAGKRPKFTDAACPVTGCEGTVTGKLWGDGSQTLICTARCPEAALNSAIDDLRRRHAANGNGKVHHEEPRPDEDDDQDRKESISRWKRVLAGCARGFLRKDDEYHKPHLTADLIFDSLMRDLSLALAEVEARPPHFLTPVEVKEDVESVARWAIEEFIKQRKEKLDRGFNGAVEDDKQDEEARMEEERSVIIWEDHAAAVLANAEYLQRSEVVERLFYTQSISLGVGGKHQGKTTNSRTLAMSVARGEGIWGRKTAQGHVIYAASDDEVATTRMQLLKMGWREGADPLALVRIRPDAKADPDRVLAELAYGAQKLGTVLIILDMLFDFARIKDEMSYAGTREAIGKIQTLADITKAHVHSTHHSPKYLTDVASAATAALGSQGIAARFSPILLTRKFGDDLFTIESTMTRDPRGLALPQTCITLDERGWARSAGPFKSWMKWKMYAGRVMSLFEGGEPGIELSVVQIAKDLDLPRPEVQNCLFHLVKDDGRLKREKRGRSYRYMLRDEELFEGQKSSVTKD